MKPKKVEKKFVYHARGKDAVKKRATQQGGTFDPIFVEGLQVFTPKEGDFRLRILPPTWKKPDHYGMDIYVHYGIGADNQSYLCLDKMKGQPCPVCEERRKAEKEGDADYAKTLAPNRRVLVWVIDRKDQEAGPMLWSMPWTLDKDVAKRCIEEDSGEVLPIDDPDNGYDIAFTKEGKGLKTKYLGIKVARKSSPVADDAAEQSGILEFISENPLDAVLLYFEYAYITGVFAGQKERAEKDESEDETEEDADEEKSVKKPAKSKPWKDEDEDTDEEDEDEDADEKPVKKPSKSKKVEPDEDEDEEDADEEDEDEEDEEESDDEDEKPAKKSVKSKRVKPDEDEEDEDADEEDEEDESEDEDEEDEDEKPAKKSAGKASLGSSRMHLNAKNKKSGGR